jgi:hypothetical protein
VETGVAEKAGDRRRPRNRPAIPIQQSIFVLDGFDGDPAASRTAPIAALQSGARHDIRPVMGDRNPIAGREGEDPRRFFNCDSGRACDRELAHP